MGFTLATAGRSHLASLGRGFRRRNPVCAMLTSETAFLWKLSGTPREPPL
jgi:hypothetical protein